MARALSAEVAIASGNDLGESIVWDDRSGELVWVDIHRALLERGRVGAGTRTARLPERVGAIGLRAEGGLVAAFASRFVLLGDDGVVVKDLPTVEQHLVTTRLNDGKVDRQGRFVCGGMDEAADQQPISAVYRLDVDGSVHQVIDAVGCANSIAFSPEGTRMFFSDMQTGRILVFDYDTQEGVPHSPRVFADGSEHPGAPDGSAVDADGCLWNARWGDGTVIRYAPDGRVDTIVQVPAAHPTCPAFGDDDLSTLYVTSARFGRTEDQLREEPHAGSVFAVRVGVGGLVEPRYLG